MKKNKELNFSKNLEEFWKKNINEIIHLSSLKDEFDLKKSLTGYELIEQEEKKEEKKEEEKEYEKEDEKEDEKVICKNNFYKRFFKKK